MNKILPFFGWLLTLLYISCATSAIPTIEINLERLPLVDLSNIDTITVIPFEWGGSEKYSYLTVHITQALVNGIKNTNFYNYVEPSLLLNVNKLNYWEHVDAYIMGKIKNITSVEVKEKNEKNTTKTITVTVEIEYDYIHANSNEILGNFNKQVSGSVTYVTNGKDDDSSFSWFVVKTIINGISNNDNISGNNSTEENIAISLAKHFSQIELIPWIRTEKRQVLRDKEKNKKIKEAEKLVNKKEYLEAIKIYKNIYENTGNFIAGYNTALLLEATGQFIDALILLKDIDNKIIQLGMNRPYYIGIEIMNLRKYLNLLKTLEVYKR